MKNLKKCLMFAAYSIIVATALTSCLDSDDDGNYLRLREMTEVEKAQYLAVISGGYSGEAIYTHLDSKSNKAYADTVDVTWVVRQDKSIEIIDLPDSIFWHYMDSKSETTEAVKNATTTTNVEFPIAGMWVQEYTNGTVYSELFTVGAKDTEHEFSIVRNEDGTDVSYPVTVKFADSGRYGSSMGVYNTSKREIAIQLVLSGVKAEMETKADEAILLTGKKL